METRRLPCESAKDNAHRGGTNGVTIPDEYVEAIKAVNESDEFAFTCINMGVPLGIATAINTEIVRVLDECNVMKATPEQISSLHTTVQ